MKQLLLIGVLILGLCGLGFYLMTGRSPAPAPPAAHPPKDGPTSVTNDPPEIFRKAFWRHPSAADKILHAERREWNGSGELEKWQSFIVVEPSPELLKYLIHDNAFNLLEAPAAIAPQNPPTWFIPSKTGMKILRATGGQMQVAFDSSKNLLFASDAGKGFQPGAENQPPPPAPTAAPAGRLPAGPPPTPSE